jgi:hypothetical protein
MSLRNNGTGPLLLEHHQPEFSEFVSLECAIRNGLI